MLAAPAAAPAATVDISGSTTALPLVADLAWFYRHDVQRPGRFTLVGGGTGAGIADAARGIVDIGLASRPRAPTDPAGLTFTPFAASAVCLVTHAANPLPGLTRAQLQDLVAARTTSWAHVAGSPRSDAIEAAGLAEGAGARSVFFSTFVDEGTPVAYFAHTFATAAQVRDYVRATPAPGATSTSRSAPACTSSRSTASAATAPRSRPAPTRPARPRVRDARRTAPGRGALHPLGAHEPGRPARDRDALRAAPARGRPRAPSDRSARPSRQSWW